MSKIRDLVNEGFNELGADAELESVANYAWRKANKSDLFPLVVNEAWSVRRSITRRVESQVFNPRPASTTSERVAYRDPAEIRAAFLAETFRVNGRTIRWGDATPDDHREYAELLRSLAAGTVQTAERHEKAAALIEEKGMKSLNDLDDADLEGLEA